MRGALSILVVAAALLPVLPSAALAPGAQIDGRPGEWVVTAEAPAAGTLEVHLSAAEAASVHVIVTTEDPLEGLVVASIAHADVAPDAPANLVFEGLRPDAAFDIVVVPADAPFEPLAEGTVLPDATHALHLPRLAEVAAPPPPPDDRVHVLEGHPIVQGLPGGQIVTTPSGLVVVAWAASAPGAPHASPEIHFVASTDGGRTFGKPTLVATDVAPVGQGWRMLAGADGVLTFMFPRDARDLRAPAGLLPGLAWVRHEPVSGGRLAGGIIDDSVIFLPGYDAVALADGAVLVAAREFIDAASQERVPTVRLIRVEPTGEAHDVATFDSAWGTDGVPTVHVAASPTGEIVVVWHARAANDALAVVRSSDGGRSFGPPAFSWDLTRRAASHSVVELAVDPDGTAHILVLGLIEPEDARVRNETLLYARIQVTGEAHVARITGRLNDAIVPESAQTFSPVMAVKGSRVWLLWSDLQRVGVDETDAPVTYGLESVDGGRTFRAPYRAISRAGSTINPYDATTFLDGRPLLLAPYPYADGTWWLSAVPLFDPLAGLAESARHRIIDSILARRAPPPPADAGDETVPLEADLDAPSTEERPTLDETAPRSTPSPAAILTLTVLASVALLGPTRRDPRRGH